MHESITTPAANWPDALASVADAYATAAAIGAGHAPGSEGESEFSEAAGAIGEAIERLIDLPAPDFAAVSTKLKLLDQEFGGADTEQLQAIQQDLCRLAEIPDHNLTNHEGGN